MTQRDAALGSSIGGGVPKDNNRAEDILRPAVAFGE
jgi:hypothetical protein